MDADRNETKDAQPGRNAALGESATKREIRKEIVRRSRRKACRFIDKPNKWHPSEVRSPMFAQEYFTPASAWELIADRFEAGQEFEEVEQDDPPGVKAYQATIDLKLDPPSPLLFVKVRLGHGGQILGRSFHYYKPTSPEAT